MSVYHNENDPFAADCLELLIAGGHIAPGVVDRRSIVEVQPDDLKEFAQCHFFAGIGGWPLALRMAGVSDDQPIWTGSCPCQPFSAAGKRKGVADARHLWPEFQRLIAECHPPVVFGEQVASKDGRLWLTGVRADLEALGYGVGAADLCAAGIGAPHIRQRLFWVADADQGQRRRIADWERRQFHGAQTGRVEGNSFAQPSRTDGGVADAVPAGRPERRPGARLGSSPRSGGDSGLAEPQEQQSHWRRDTERRRGESTNGSGLADSCGDGREQSAEVLRRRQSVATWCRSVFIPCTDGKLRRIPANETGEPEPALFPLAHGIPNRVGTLRGAGNAIVPALAAEFIGAFLECNG